MATKPNSTAPAALSTSVGHDTIKTLAAILTPVWIILAIVIHDLVTGEVSL